MADVHAQHEVRPKRRGHGWPRNRQDAWNNAPQERRTLSAQDALAACRHNDVLRGERSDTTKCRVQRHFA